MNSSPDEHPSDRSRKYLFTGRLANSKYLPNAAKYNYHNRVRTFVDADGTLALRERWLSHWNPYHDPKRVACVTALDNAWYACAAIPNVVKSLYETGSMEQCGRAYQELIACMRVKVKATSDSDKAMRELEAVDPLEHIYTTPTAVTPIDFQLHALVRDAQPKPNSTATTADGSSDSKKTTLATPTGPPPTALTIAVTSASHNKASAPPRIGEFGARVVERGRGNGIWHLRDTPPLRFQYDLVAPPPAATATAITTAAST